MVSTDILVPGFTPINEGQKIFNPNYPPAESCFAPINKRKLSGQQDPATGPQRPIPARKRRRSPSPRPTFRPKPKQASPALIGQHPDQGGSQKTQKAAPAPRPRHPNQNVLLLQRGRMPIKTQGLWIEDLTPPLHRGQYRPDQFLLLNDDDLSGRIAAPEFYGVTWHATGKPTWSAAIYQLLARIPEHQATSANLYYLATEWIPELDLPDPQTYLWGMYTHNCRASLARSPEFEPVHPPKLQLHTIVAAPNAQAEPIGAPAAPAVPIVPALPVTPAAAIALAAEITQAEPLTPDTPTIPTSPRTPAPKSVSPDVLIATPAQAQAVIGNTDAMDILATVCIMELAKLEPATRTPLPG